MRRTPQSNVLFVNIGWAERYDGKHTIHGGHQDIRNQLGNPSTLGEGKAFLRDTIGRVRCVVGMGRVVPSSSIDVVFVARHPNTRRHEMVGLYFKSSFSYSDWQNPKGRIETWAEASTTEVEELLGNRRPAVDWPQGRSMRRWTRRSGTILFEDLFKQYVDLI